MRKADRARVDVKRQHRMPVYRINALFYNAPPLQFVFNAELEDGTYRELKGFEFADGSAQFDKRIRRDHDNVDSIKEVDG